MWQNVREWLKSLFGDACTHDFKVISRVEVLITGYGFREKYVVQCKKCAKSHTRHVRKDDGYQNEALEHAANHNQLLGEEL